MFKKLAKEIYRIGCWIGKGIRTYNEKKANIDNEIQPYVRPSRNYKNLPDSWTNTRWIHLKKSWKARSKVKHQWEKHKQSKQELNLFFDNLNIKKQILYKLSKKHTLYLTRYNNWYDIIDYDYYKAAEQLIEQGLVDPIYKVINWNFDDFGVIKHKSQKCLIGVKLKENINE